MTFARSTLSEINGRVQSDFDTKMPGADSRVRRNVVNVSARALSGVANSLYGAIDQRTRFFPSPDNPEGNARWASMLQITRKAATPGSAIVTLTGNDDADEVEAGTVLVRADGARYVTLADATIVAGTAEVAVAAQGDGLASSLAPAQQLTFLSPVAGVGAVAVVSGVGLVPGADQESETDFCGRIWERMRTGAAGGKPSDYERWAKTVPGVTRVWVEENWDGFGTVRVQFVMDGRPDIIPTVDDVALVTAAIQAERPCCAEVTVIAPTPTPRDFTIVPSPDTPEVRAAIAAELDDLIAREAVPGGTLLLTHMREAISIAPGENDHVLSSPTANETVASDHITTMGDITWPS